MPRELQQKVYDVLDAGAVALELAYRHGVPLLFGTDLLGAMHKNQLNEIHLRKSVVSAADIIRSATCNAADAFSCPGEFGQILPGARADMLVLDKNPLEDINVLTQPDHHLMVIMRDGRIYKDAL